MNTKKCNKCNLELNVDMFYFRNDIKSYRNECKKCFHSSRKEYISKYKKDNVEVIKKKNKEYNNLESTKKRQKEWRKSNRENLLQYGKKYRIENVENIKRNNKRYYSKNKDKINDKGRIYKNKKYKSDVVYKLIKVVRSTIYYSIRGKGYFKKTKTEEILGCSIKSFKIYLESKFEPWMNWENYGKYNGELNYGWDIDHIIPISSGKTEEEIIKLNHYTNLHPLDSLVNRNIKRNKK